MSGMTSEPARPKTWPHLAAWLVIGFAFAPSLLWLAGVAGSRDQVRDAGVVLLFAVLYHVLYGTPQVRRRVVLDFGPRCVLFTSGACALALAASFFRLPVLMIPSLGLLSGGLLLFLLGEEMIRAATGLAIAFSGFTILAIIMPLADIPLRIFAGRAAAAVLALLGYEPSLGVTGDPPMLLLVSGGWPFEVAPECNGFGITGTCTLLALLLAFAKPIPVLDRILVVIFAPLVGLFSNALRIVAIVALAPIVGHSGYHAMHESVGILLYIVTLAFVWWVVSGLPDRGLQR